MPVYKVKALPLKAEKRRETAMRRQASKINYDDVGDRQLGVECQRDGGDGAESSFISALRS